jgi:sugar lactone lactonase YvrE
MPSETRRAFLTSIGAAAAVLAVPRWTRAQSPRVRTIAGTGTAGYDPQIAEATRTPITDPYGLVIGPDGALYFVEVDTGYTRRLDLSTGRLSTIAGNGKKGYAGDGGPALAASMTMPHEIRFDRAGNLFIVERDAHVVRRVDAKSRIVSTVAGTGTAGFSGDGGPANQAMLRQPHSIAFDAGGRLLICDIGNRRVRAVDMATGVITTLAGTGERGATPDEGAFDAVPLNGPRSLDTDPDGNVYLVLREGNAVFRLDLRARRLRRLAGTGRTGFSGDGGPALEAAFNGPKGVAYSADGSLYIADTENHAIRRLDLRTGLISTVLGTGERGDGPDGDPRRCRLARPHGICRHGSTLYVSDSENNRVRELA